MIAEHFGNPFYGLQPATHGSCVPLIEEFHGPSPKNIFPESLEIFLEQISSHRLQVVLEKIAEFINLLAGQVLWVFQQKPSPTGQNRRQSTAPKFLGFTGRDLGDDLVHMTHDIEPVENIDCLRRHLCDDPEVRLSHVAANKTQLLTFFRIKPLAEASKGFNRPVLSYPEQPALADYKLQNVTGERGKALMRYVEKSN